MSVAADQNVICVEGYTLMVEPLSSTSRVTMKKTIYYTGSI